MNKREKELLCMLIAETEWRQGGSTSEAAANNLMIESLRQIFPLPEDELLFHRTYSMGKAVCLQNGREMGDAWFDALSEMVDEIGYLSVIDLLEGETSSAFYARVEAAA